MNWKEILVDLLDLQPETIVEEVTVEVPVPYEVVVTEPKEYSLDLTKFETNKVFEVNGSYILLNTLLNSELQYDAVSVWVDKHSILDDLWRSQDVDTVAKALRLAIYIEAQGGLDIHTPDKTENWRTPIETIDSQFKVDCEDMSIFIHYVYQVISDRLSMPELKERIYCNVGSTLTTDGYVGGNHFNLIWRHTDGHYYQIESAYSNGSDYIRKSLAWFGEKNLPLNRRFGKSVWMFNNSEIYYKVDFAEGYD